MKNREVIAMTMPFNLQFFADGDGAGAGEGDAGNGAGSGDNGSSDGDDGGSGDSGEGNKPQSFDDVLNSNKDYQAELDRRITQALKTQKTKLETLMDDKATEAEKLAKMTKDEKAQYLQQKKEKEIADREVEVTRKELMAEAKNTLAEKKLPVSLAEVLNYSDADACNKSIEAIGKAFQEAVEAAVEEKLKGGKPPRKADGNGNAQLDEIMKAMSL